MDSRETIAGAHALVGFDGFVDSITRLVDVRSSMEPSAYRAITSIRALAERIGAAAGLSTNIERVTVEDRFGGNGPLMAGALARLGAPVAFVGAIGEVGGASSSAGGGAIHPQFAEFASRCAEVVAVGPPSHTVCLEFDDGKVMLNETGAVQAVTWARVVEVVGRARLEAMVARARLLGIVNWSLMGGVPGIWEGLAREVLPRVGGIAGADGARRLFVDLSDPAKRTDADVGAMLGHLRMLEGAGLRVMLGLNMAEASRIARVAGVRDGGDAVSLDGVAVAALARDIRARTGLSEVVVHPRHGAAACAREGGGVGGGEGGGAESAAVTTWVDGPLVASPRLSTGAGDHFNAGYALARTIGLGLAEALAVGVSTSGAYVRDAESPTVARVCEVLGGLGTREGGV
jgi:hypothetical protein